MLFILYYLVILLLVIYLLIAGLYQVILAVAYFMVKDTKISSSNNLNRFAILVPAHNEELLISKMCESLIGIKYPTNCFDIFIVSDNSTDKTEEICAAYPVIVLSRHDTLKAGKGYALEWALVRISLNNYDAVLIVDADTTVKPDILTELNVLLNRGEQAIQCYIEIPNRNESWFTQLISLSRTINDLFYHYSKYKLSLSAYLMGTGMCFKASLLENKKWNAFSLSEDWEYFARLIEDGYRIGFAANAVVYQQESSSLKQATSQRLRWASGRFFVVKNLGMKLFLKGIRRRDLVMIDASLSLLFPNWSLQINLILLTLLASLFLPVSSFKTTILGIGFVLLGIQALIVIAGMYLAGNPLSTLKAVLVAPVFLVWKFFIDLLCVTGLYRGKKWIRTERHIPNEP